MHSHSLKGVGNAMGQRHHDWREHIQVDECFKQNEPLMIPDILAGIEILHDCVPPPPAAGPSHLVFSNLSQSHCDQEFQSQKTQDMSSGITVRRDYASSHPAAGRSCLCCSKSLQASTRAKY